MAAPTRATPESMNENMPEPSSEAVPASANICISPKMNMTIPINVTIILAIAPGKMNRRIPITISTPALITIRFNTPSFLWARP